MGRSRSSAASFNTGCVLCLTLIILLVLSLGIAARKLADSSASHVGTHRSHSSSSPSAVGNNNNPALGKNNNPAAAGKSIAYRANPNLPICNTARYQNCIPSNNSKNRGCKPYERCPRWEGDSKMERVQRFH